MAVVAAAEVSMVAAAEVSMVAFQIYLDCQDLLMSQHVRERGEASRT